MQRNVNKVPVTARALLARINRALAKDGAKMCAAHTANARAALGDYYIVNDCNAVTAQRCTLDGIGRKLGVLRAYEELTE